MQIYRAFVNKVAYLQRIFIVGVVNDNQNLCLPIWTASVKCEIISI